MLTMTSSARSRAPRIYRNVLRLAMGTMLLGMPACSGEPTAPAQKFNTGTYALMAVDDQQLPAVIHNGPYYEPQSGTFFNLFHYEVTAGYIELRDDDTFYAALDILIETDLGGDTGTLELRGTYRSSSHGLELNVEEPFQGSQGVSIQDDWLRFSLTFLGPTFPSSRLDFQWWKQ